MKSVKAVSASAAGGSGGGACNGLQSSVLCDGVGGGERDRQDGPCRQGSAVVIMLRLRKRGLLLFYCDAHGELQLLTQPVLAASRHCIQGLAAASHHLCCDARAHTTTAVPAAQGSPASCCAASRAESWCHSPLPPGPPSPVPPPTLVQPPADLLDGQLHLIRYCSITAHTTASRTKLSAGRGEALSVWHIRNTSWVLASSGMCIFTYVLPGVHANPMHDIAHAVQSCHGCHSKP